jgi:hypothetical protein
MVDAAAHILTGYSTTSTSNSAAWCASTCAAQGFSIAGTEVCYPLSTGLVHGTYSNIQYGDECYCGNRHGSVTHDSKPLLILFFQLRWRYPRYGRVHRL